MGVKYLTSESVCMGHPDKVCDQISDAILDAYLEKDGKARVAIETMVSKDAVFLAGQITSTAQVDIDCIVRNTIKRIGYDDAVKGMDYKSCVIVKNINAQSLDIALGVDQSEQGSEELGSGDQGIMYGYATDETEDYLPMPYYLATRLVKRLDECRLENKLKWLYPDGKAQVTCTYDEEGNFLGVHSIIVSCQHDDTISLSDLQESILREVILHAINIQYIHKDTKIHINPTGAFHIGGPEGDTGLTGRKLMVDTYGGIAKHGGGAFSGKDATKLDRSGAYMARYVAKNIVAAGLAKKCEVSLSYCIGCIEPEAVDVDTFETGIMKDVEIAEKVRASLKFSVRSIIDSLKLTRPVFEQTASYGHFGNPAYAWEQLDQVSNLK